jgi:V8-like Glu-specific endopeptidase
VRDGVQPWPFAPAPVLPIFMNRMSPRRPRSWSVLLVLITALAWRVDAQTLAEAAKRASESSAAANAPSRSFSDRDLKSSVAADGVIPTAEVDADVVAPPGPVLSREEIVNRVLPAVVTIQAGNATGTGFFVDRDLVMTNHHVVGDASVVRVRLSDGTGSTGTVWRLASDADLALVHVDGVGSGIRPVVLGSYRHLQAGEDVVAIGSSLGVLQNTVTRGIVSAVRRSSGVVYVQTDAAINPGNSGGPLVDKYGRVVGVNTAKVMGAESIGFSIAIDHGRRLINGQTAVADRAAPDATRSDSDSNVFSSPRTSDSDDRHHAGLAAYDAALHVVSAQADDMDSAWREYATWCGVGVPSAPTGGRAWFAIWSAAGAPGGSAGSNCASMRTEILEHASRVKAAMMDASERARRADVYPGEIRDLRRKYSLDYDGW